MSVITRTNPAKRTSTKLSIPLWEAYMAYADRQGKAGVLWYLKAIMVIPCAIMVPSIFAMAMVTSSYIWFVALSMLLFFANVVVHIAEVKSRLYVPLYHATIIILILIPFISYLISL